jgi:DMSO/TMAO reductase YedYZ molybdopterin-dependent catalytic subunit
VTIGIALVPLLLAKLWSVIPRLFVWPPARSPAQAIERASLALLVGGVLFQFATGIVNAQVYYPFRFNFVVAHYYGAVVFTAALLVHLVVKFPAVRRAYRERGVLAPLRDDLARTRPEPPDRSGLVAVAPSPPTMSRRGLLAFAGGASLVLLVTTAGRAVGGPLRPLALQSPRGTQPGDGPNGFLVNKTARAAGIDPATTGPGWRLEIAGGVAAVRLARADLLALPQRTESLPIACVEGWSTTQAWTGVPLADLARMAGATGRPLRVESLQARGVLRTATLTPDQVADERALLALRVNGADLSLDHGFPARIIVPALPGVHCTKWVARLTFLAA